MLQRGKHAGRLVAARRYDCKANGEAEYVKHKDSFSANVRPTLTLILAPPSPLECPDAAPPDRSVDPCRLLSPPPPLPRPLQLLLREASSASPAQVKRGDYGKYHDRPFCLQCSQGDQRDWVKKLKRRAAGSSAVRLREGSAPSAPTHLGAPPEQHGGSPWPQEPASRRA